MSEQQNCPTSVHVFGESNAGPTKNNYCQDRTESISEISKSVRILSEFRYIYEERLRKIDEETGGKGMELKLKTLTSWVNDLGEQNLMLVETVEQLEREAAGRVALLEERLRKSSHVALEYMSKLQEYDNQIWDLSEGKTVPMVLPYKASNGLVQAQQTEEILKTRVSNLQNDISGLLELIRRVRYEGSWDTNGLGFLEVTYEDIFGSYPHQAPCDTPKPVVFDASVSPKMTFGNHELDSASWRQKNNFGTEEIEDLNKKLEDVNSHLQETMKENERLVKEIGFLSAELKSKTDKITALSQNTSEIDKNELEYRITDLEATYLRLERSWDHAWEISKSGALEDLIYYQNASEERNTGESKSLNFDIPEKMTWCTAGMKKDQERIKELCGEIKSLLQSTQQCSVKRGVSFASPSKEDYKLQVQELQKALKQAQNGVELARKQITKNIIGLKAIRSKCALVARYYQEQSYPRKMEEVNENVFMYETSSYPFFGDNNEQGDLLAINDPRRKVDLEKKLLLHEKMSESQMKVIENLQEELEVLQRRNKELQEESKERQCRKYDNCESDSKEQLNDKIKENEMKIHSLECDLFLAEVMMYEKNKIIQMLLYKLQVETGKSHFDFKRLEKNRFGGGDLDRKLDLEEYFTDMPQSDLQISQYEMEKEHEKFSVFTLQRCTHCNTLYKRSNETFNLMEKLQMEVDTLKSTVSAKEKVILDQQEMLNLQQEALTMSQEEVKELQSQLKKMECYNEDESKQVQEQLIAISNLHQDLMTTRHHLEELQDRSSFNTSFEDEERKNKALQSRCQDFERKFQEAKEYWLYLLKQVRIIEQEMIKRDYQQTKIMKTVMSIIACIKHFCSKYLVEEEIIVSDDFHSGSEEQGTFELVRVFPSNENDTIQGGEKTGHIGVVDLVSKNLEEEFENLKVQNSICGMNIKTDLFKNIHLNELRKKLDAGALQTKRTGKLNSGLPMSYSEAVSYCNYMEHEINKLQDLLLDFQWQMSPIEIDGRGQIDFCSSQAKMENLEMVLNETSEYYKKASLDCCKYQEQLLNAAEREVVLQEDFTEKERYWLEKMNRFQAENLNYADVLQNLNEEIDLLQLELNERDCQLQNTASSLRALSIESSFLHKELQKQEMNVEKLEEQLLQNNIKLQQALSYLDEKNHLLQKLNKENQNMQDRLKNLETKFQSSMTTERHTFLQEISNLKLSIQQLKKLQEKSTLEVREHWWWDDGWQIW